MKRRQARRILGLDRRAAGDHVELAHERLRAHVEGREGRESPAAGSARERELAALDAARDVLLAAQPSARRALWIAALVGLAIALCLGVWLGFGGSLFGAGGGNGDELGAAATPAMARLSAPSGIDGAWLRVVDAGSGAVRLEAPADETVHEIPSGRVRVQVGHADCGPAWERDLEVAPGGEHALAPEPCAGTGWLIVESDEDRDRLVIDGVDVGAPGRTGRALTVGEHDVRVERPGHEAWEGKVELEAGQTLALWASPHAVAVPEPQPARPEPAPTVAARDEPDDGRRFSSWHGRAREWLLSLYDRDRSDALDTEEEVRAVPCRSWEGLAQSYARQGLALSMTRLYGFDGDGFVDGALGVSPRVRDVAYARMRECGLP